MMTLKWLTFSILICSNFILSQSYNPVNKVVFLSEELKNTMDSILHDSDFYYRKEKHFIICELLVDKDKKGLNISVEGKLFFQRSILRNGLNLIGYTEYRDYLILIWGKEINGLFTRTNEVQNFEFLSLRKTKTKSRSKKGINIPMIYEPTVWKYEIINNRIYFKEKSCCEVLGYRGIE